MPKAATSTPDLRQLRAFAAVARARGFGKAEGVLAVQQPAISKLIASLEKNVGARLFDRHRRGVTLTPAGERLLASCDRIFAELAGMERSLSDERHELRGELRIGANEHVATYLLPRLLAELGQAHPALIPRVFTGPAELLVAQIAEGQIELGLFFRARRSPNIERLLLARVPCQLVVQPGAGRDKRVLESFIGSREIDDVANKAFPTVDMLKQKRPATAITLSCNSLEAHKRLVAAGCGVSVLPRFMVEEEIRRGELELLHPEYEYWASLELLTGRGHMLSKNAHAFLLPFKRSLRARGWPS